MGGAGGWDVKFWARSRAVVDHLREMIADSLAAEEEAVAGEGCGGGGVAGVGRADCGGATEAAAAAAAGGGRLVQVQGRETAAAEWRRWRQAEMAEVKQHFRTI